MIFFINAVATSGYYDIGVILKGKNNRSVFRMSEWGLLITHTRNSPFYAPLCLPVLRNFFILPTI